jgi:hypothetical protein
MRGQRTGQCQVEFSHSMLSAVCAVTAPDGTVRAARSSLTSLTCPVLRLPLCLSLRGRGAGCGRALHREQHPGGGLGHQAQRVAGGVARHVPCSPCDAHY